jgi:hypothetical protein
VLHQLFGDRQPVDALAAGVQFAHAQEDAAVLFQGEVVGVQAGGHLNVERAVDQHGAEHAAFGVDAGGQTFFKVHVNRGHGTLQNNAKDESSERRN